MKNATSNLHAANATSVVGNTIPSRVVSATPSMAPPAPMNAAAVASSNAMAAAAAAAVAQQQAQQQMNLNHVRSAFKPALPTGVPTSNAVPIPNAAAVAAATAAAAAAAVPSNVSPNMAGAGALHLSGRWSLDREDSDSTNDYLEAMVRPAMLMEPYALC